MSKRQILMLLGVWITAFMFIGFLSDWYPYFTVISGLLITGIAYSLKPEGPARQGLSVPFVEHKSVEQEQKVQAETQKPETKEIPADSTAEKDIISDSSSIPQ